jgi:hypothetical protein
MPTAPLPIYMLQARSLIMERKAYKFPNVKNFFFRAIFQSFQKARIRFYELLEYTMFSSLSAKYINQ